MWNNELFQIDFMYIYVLKNGSIFFCVDDILFVYRKNIKEDKEGLQLVQ